MPCCAVVWLLLAGALPCGSGSCESILFTKTALVCLHSKSSVVQSTKSALASLDRARFCWRDPPPHDRLTDADIGFAFEWLGQGEIGYGEFSQLWSGLQGFCSTEARRMFDKFDTDGSGEIDRYAPTGAALLRLMKVAWRVVSKRSI